MKVLTSNTDHGIQLKNQSLWERLVKEINGKIICDQEILKIVEMSS